MICTLIFWNLVFGLIFFKDILSFQSLQIISKSTTIGTNIAFVFFQTLLGSQIIARQVLGLMNLRGVVTEMFSVVTSCGNNYQC